VTVVGGGPAGMWAAKMAGRRGHKVTLIDRNENLGGQVLTAMKGAGRDEFGVIVRNEKGQVDKAGVTVRLGESASTEQLLGEHPDVVIIATGSQPKAQPVGGAEGPGIFNVWQVLNGEADLGENVCLIDYDGHHRASATAEFLANLGKKVHMITSSLFVGAELGPTQDLYLARQRLLQKGVSFTPDIAVMEVSGEIGAKVVKGFNVYNNVWDQWGPYDSLVLAMGQKVDDALYMSLKGKVPELYRIGDSVAPRKADMAIWEGHRVGREI
jgi:thioredoxin reductase